MLFYSNHNTKARKIGQDGFDDEIVKTLVEKLEMSEDEILLELITKRENNVKKA
jgi:hypothetical protein